MGKRRRKKTSSTLTWKAARGFFRLLFKGVLEVAPLLFLGGIGFGIFWGIRENLYADPGFLVQALEVAPPKALAPERVQELERLYLNQNLFKISPSQVAQEVERDPMIGEARVVRKFPTTLRIEVRLRDPYAQIQFSLQGPYYVTGEDEVVLAKDWERNKNLLLIEAFEAKAVKAEKGEELSLTGFPEAVELVKAFRTHPLAQGETVERVRLDHLGNVALVLAKGPELRFGTEPMKRFYALGSLAPLLRGPDRKQIIYIELQYQDLIVRKK